MKLLSGSYLEIDWLDQTSPMSFFCNRHSCTKYLCIFVGWKKSCRRTFWHSCGLWKYRLYVCMSAQWKSWLCYAKKCDFRRFRKPQNQKLSREGGLQCSSQTPQPIFLAAHAASKRAGAWQKISYFQVCG